MNNDTTTPKPEATQTTSDEGLDGAACSSVFIVKSGMCYQPPHIVAVYRNKEDAERAVKKLADEQTRHDAALHNPDTTEWQDTDWSEYAVHDYAEMSQHELL